MGLGLAGGLAYDLIVSSLKNKPLSGHPVTIGALAGFGAGLAKDYYQGKNPHLVKNAYIKMKIREGKLPKKLPNLEELLKRKSL